MLGKQDNKFYVDVVTCVRSRPKIELPILFLINVHSPIHGQRIYYESAYIAGLLSFMRARDESDDEEALISSESLAHSTLTHVFPSVKHSDIDPETTLSPPAPVCLQKKALLIGVQYYNSTNAQLDSENGPDTSAGGQLKGPHVDVQNMRQLLLGKAFRCYHSHGILRSDYFLCHIVMASTTKTISQCSLTTAIANMPTKKEPRVCHRYCVLVLE